MDTQGALCSYLIYMIKVLPTSQILQLWDEINLPHKEKKQVSGSILTVIGIKVDANALTMTMPEESLHDLLAAITDFVNSHCKVTLKEWQRLAGWINWSLNAFPLLRPSLNNFYAKISGKNTPNRYMRIYNAVQADLTCAIGHLQQDTGIHLIQQIWWDTSSADFTIYCDTCLEGMGFWEPDKCVGFYSPVPQDLTEEQIFYFKALCVLSMIHHLIDTHNPPQSSHLLIYTDNDNTVVYSTPYNAYRVTTTSSLMPPTPLSTITSIH